MDIIEGKKINYRGFDGVIFAVYDEHIEITCGSLGNVSFTEIISYEDVQMLQEENLLVEIVEI